MALEPKPPVRRPNVRRATLAQCRTVAAPIRGEGDFAGDLAVVDMPPQAGDGGEPATRRLRALRAIDVLNGQLERASRRPDLYFQLGQIYLWSLENPDEALRYGCRALLLAWDARSPAVRRYELGVLTAWMADGMEDKLELALRPGERNLPWRAALREARALVGTTWEGRARALDGAITAQRLVRNNRLLSRRRDPGTIDDLPRVLRDWIDSSGDPVWVVVSFPSRYRGRVRDLRHREAEGTPARVWATEGPGPRWLLYGSGRDGVDAVIAYAGRRLAGRELGVSIRQGIRCAYLIGRLSGTSLALRFFAAKPDALGLEEAVQRPDQ